MKTMLYRIQPAGLGIDHVSEGSTGSSGGLFVFSSPHHLHQLDVPAHYYGDEVVVLEGDMDDLRDGGDVEGEVIDPSRVRLVCRLSFAEWTRLAGAEPGVRIRGLCEGDETCRSIEAEIGRRVQSKRGGSDD